ncbi:MAG: hypothetical protein QXR69_01920 [Conexivisphaerales archaeon]
MQSCWACVMQTYHRYNYILLIFGIRAQNDFGLGMANSIAAIMAGAEVAHVTVNGIGERTGNTSLEELVMALRLLYGITTSVRAERLRDLSKLVESLSEINLPPQKPVVGDDIFTIESGIIAGWWRRLEKIDMPLEMYPFVPELVGHGKIKVILGKKSDKGSIYYMLEKKGMEMDEKEAEKVLTEVKELSIKNKRYVTNDEFMAIVKKHKNKAA